MFNRKICLIALLISNSIWAMHLTEVMIIENNLAQLAHKHRDIFEDYLIKVQMFYPDFFVYKVTKAPGQDYGNYIAQTQFNTRNKYGQSPEWELFKIYKYNTQMSWAAYQYFKGLIESNNAINQNITTMLQNNQEMYITEPTPNNLIHKEIADALASSLSSKKIEKLYKD